MSRCSPPYDNSCKRILGDLHHRTLDIWLVAYAGARAHLGMTSAAHRPKLLVGPLESFPCPCQQRTHLRPLLGSIMSPIASHVVVLVSRWTSCELRWQTEPPRRPDPLSQDTSSVKKASKGFQRALKGCQTA